MQFGYQLSAARFATEEQAKQVHSTKFQEAYNAVRCWSAQNRDNMMDNVLIRGGIYETIGPYDAFR